MKTFKTFFESKKNQEYEVNRAITSLLYQKGYDLPTISKMPIEQLLADIQSLSLLPTTSWLPARFAAMIKHFAKINI